MARGIKVSPIKPSEIAKAKKKILPNAVIEAFNELIAKKFSDGSAMIYQDDIVELMVQKGLDREEIFDRGWLEVEDVYRAAGWDVSYDKPAYNESYPAAFTFRRKS